MFEQKRLLLKRWRLLRVQPMIERVDEFHKTEDFHGAGRVIWTAVPAFTAAQIIWECPQWSGLVLTYARQPFSEKLALSVIEHVNRVWDGKMRGRRMVILPSLGRDARAQMDVVVLLGLPHLNKVGTIDPSLDDRTVFAFPAYRCEFSGHESPDMFDELIHGQSDIGNWNRPVQAQIWIDICNPDARERGRLVGELCLTDFETVVEEITELSRPEDSVTLKNFRGAVMEIRPNTVDGLLVELANGAQTEVFESATSLLPAVEKFLILGEWETRKRADKADGR
jgi:hypothetical protein